MTRPPAHETCLRLDPTTTVLVRPSGAVQLGWDPETALLIRPPGGVTALALADVLRLLDGRRAHGEIVWAANRAGIDTADIELILRELAGTGLALDSPTDAADRRTPSRRVVHVHGRGPLADAVATTLHGDVRVGRSAPDHVADIPAFHRADCVVLADAQVPDPRTVAALMGSGTPHLAVRLRDGRGLVGPLVVPGRTSCLRCADLTRTAHDPEWPHLAVQLLGLAGHAGPATLTATAALAAGEVEVFLGGGEAASLDTTLELHLRRATLTHRHWTRHPDCTC